MIAANLLSKRSLSLKKLCSEIIQEEMTPIEDLIGKGKDQISFKNVSIEKAVDYSCADADVTLRLKNIFEKDLDKSGLMKIMNETLDGEYTCENVDLRHVKDRYDDLIFVVKRVDE